MLRHPTLENLQMLKLFGMVRALGEQMEHPEIEQLSFEERLGLLVDRETTERQDRRLKSRLGKAKLKQNACVEDINYRHRRGLDKSVVTRLYDCQWVKDHLNILITGPTGIGKTWLACAFAQKACREDYTAFYIRVPKLFQALSLSRGDGSYPKLMNTLAKTSVLILDDWGLSKLTAEQRRDMLEVLEDRHGVRSTIVTSQLPIDNWHGNIGDSTLADAILDRLVHGAYKINLKGESMRKKSNELTATVESE